MKKRVLSILMTAAMVISLTAGCGQKADKKGTGMRHNL